MSKERHKGQQTEPSSLGHQPGDTWSFDESVTSVFGDMLKRSIPQYGEMRKLVFDVGRDFVCKGSTIMDLGCSRGDSLAPFVGTFGRQCTYHGVEKSAPMADAARERFAGPIQQGFVSVSELDLVDGCPQADCSLTLCVLTLQFVPEHCRGDVLKQVFENTRDGGALILVEKVIGASTQIDELMVSRYHEMKQQHGYTREEVDRKKLALEGVLVPLHAADNERMLREAGFSQVDCFWRWLNFAGWLAVR